jgi:hypothetical protein
VAVAALVMAAGLSGGALLSTAAAQEAPGYGDGYGKTSPPVTSPPVTSPPVTSPPVTSPPVTSPPVTSPPVTSPPVTVPPNGGNGLPVTGVRSLTIAGVGLVLVGVGILAWVFGGRRRIRV